MSWAGGAGAWLAGSGGGGGGGTGGSGGGGVDFRLDSSLPYGPRSTRRSRRAMGFPGRASLQFFIASVPESLDLGLLLLTASLKMEVVERMKLTKICVVGDINRKKSTFNCTRI